MWQLMLLVIMLSERYNMNPAQIQKMMREAQKIQSNMEKTQKELAKQEYTTTVGGGVVEVKMLGNKQISSINIKEEAIDPEDKEMLEDMIKTAINNLINEIEAEEEKTMGQFTSGLPF